MGGVLVDKVNTIGSFSEDVRLVSLANYPKYRKSFLGGIS
jgi:hypothetical protein